MAYTAWGMVNGSYLSSTYLIDEIGTNGYDDGPGGVWSHYASYPMGVAGESCAVGGTKHSIYCVGGTDVGGSGGAAVFSTNRITGTDMAGNYTTGTWVVVRPFPGELNKGSCFFGNSSSNLYCIAGSQLEYDPEVNATSPGH